MVSEHKFLSIIITSRFAPLFKSVMELLDSDDDYKKYAENQKHMVDKQGNIMKDKYGKPKKDKRMKSDGSLKVRYLYMYYAKNHINKNDNQESDKAT